MRRLSTWMAQRIVRGEVPQSLLGARLFVLDLAALVAGASARGQFEARLKAVIAEAEAAESVVLFVDEIHGLIGGGSGGSMGGTRGSLEVGEVGRKSVITPPEPDP